MERLKIHHLALLIPFVYHNNFNISQLKFKPNSALLHHIIEYSSDGARARYLKQRHK